MTEAGAEAYYPVRLRALRDEPDAFGTSYEEALAHPLSDTVERFRSQAANADNFTLGAFDGDGRQLLGMVSFWRDTGSKFRHRGAITAMYVVPEVRGQGLGRALLVEALARARAIPGIEQVHRIVVSRNASARALYASLGFKRCGAMPRSLKLGDTYLDEGLMVLQLSQR